MAEHEHDHTNPSNPGTPIRTATRSPEETTTSGYDIAHHKEALRASSRGTFFPTLDYSNWRVKVRAASQVKLDDTAKQRYLQTLAETGRRGLAAAAAGVSNTTIQKHMKEDPEFIEAADQAYDDFRDQRVAMIENQALAGFDETIFSPTGEMATRKRYETQLRMKILDAHAPEIYGNKTQVDITFKGGAIAVPLPPSPDDWDKMFEAHSERAHLLTQGEEVPSAEARMRASGHEDDINGNHKPRT